MKVVIVVGIVLLEAFDANCFYDAFYGGAGAGHLVDGGGMRSLRRARPHRASRLLIIYESMIKLGMWLQHTLRPLIHFLDVFVNMLYSFMWLCQWLVSWDNREALRLINILDDLTIIVEVGIVAHSNALLVHPRVIREHMRILNTQAMATLIINVSELFALH